MLTTIAYVVVGVLAGFLAGLKVIAPMTKNTTDDKLESLLEKIPLETILKYVSTRKV